MKLSGLILIFYSLFLTNLWSDNSTIFEKVGLKKTKLILDKIDIQEQSEFKLSVVKFVTALNSAVETLFHDYSYVESPLALMIDTTYEELKLPWDTTLNEIVLKQAEDLLFSYLNREDTLFALVSSKDFKFETKRSLVYPPEAGELLEDNWIFYISINSYSDHMYWIIIDRAGVVNPYIYGFN